MEQDKQQTSLQQSEEWQAFLLKAAQHKEKLRTEPEYKHAWEKKSQEFAKIALLNDSEEN